MNDQLVLVVRLQYEVADVRGQRRTESGEKGCSAEIKPTGSLTSVA